MRLASSLLTSLPSCWYRCVLHQHSINLQTSLQCREFLVLMRQAARLQRTPLHVISPSNRILFETNLVREILLRFATTQIRASQKCASMGRENWRTCLHDGVESTITEEHVMDPLSVIVKMAREAHPALGRSRIYEAMRTGAPPSVRVGKRACIPLLALNAWVAAGAPTQPQPGRARLP